MAIPPPWTSDASQNEKPKSCAAATKLVSNCLLLSSAFLRTPFAPSLAAQSKPSPDIFRDFHNSLASAAHRFLANLHSVAAANPLFQKLIAFSARLTSSRPINCRNNSSNSIAAHNFAAILPGDSVAGIVVTNGILNFLNIYNTLLVVRLVLTWFPNSPPAIVSPLSTLCDPYLNIFRGIIPPLGGTLDLSPILAFLVLNVFTSTAAALPAELPVTGASHSLSSSDPQILNLTSTQKKWMRRVSGNRAKNSGGVN